MTPGVRRPRLTQAERRGATRAALLDATIDCLVKFGYAGTTTARVADLAGLSRGAQLNYFPSKAALVSGAVAHLAHKRSEELRERLKALPDGPDRVPALLDAIWDAHRGTIFDATLELWVAARTDAELQAGVLALERDVASTALDIAADVFGEESRRPGFRQDIEFVLSTVRGLALLRTASGGRLQAARGWPATRERLLALLS